MSEIMEIKDLSAVLHMPLKLDQIIRNGTEVAQGLPPSCPVEAFVVDEYPACPSNWMNGSDKASSYFLGVRQDRGMWLNFNGCVHHKHDVAVVISIQGINPITGQKTEKLRLEKYESKCPIHDVDFQQDRFCPKCKFKWPSQNYLCTTGTPETQFWIDGFRKPDGTVRQYVFTEEEMKGVASQLIGEDRVYAIGIAFYLSKNKKPILERENIIYRNNPMEDFGTFDLKNNNIPMWTKEVTYGGNDNLNQCDGIYRNFLDNSVFSSTPMASCNMSNRTIESQSIELGSHYNNIPDSMDMGLSDIIESVETVTKLEVGAGALINQKVYEDTQSLDYWQDEPFGMIYLNYCDEETLAKILKAGIRKENTEGFLYNVEIC
ncbi:MAG: hypothetical protein J7L15_04810 [Clostridiales bacterium]|nr:hypothetical protein [Clostridiales bacterium]